MCLTIPWQIKKITGQQAELTNGKKVSIVLVPNLKKGDWALVNADLAITKVSAKEAGRTLDYFEIGGKKK